MSTIYKLLIKPYDRRQIVTISILIAAFFLWLTASPIFAASPVAINEILPNPIGNDKDNEWIEFYNPSDSPISLNVYILEDRNGNRIILNGTINKWLVFYPKGENGFALANEGNTIINLYLVSNTLELIDTFTYSSSAEGKSWGRIPDGGPISEQKLNPSPEESNSLPTPTPSPTLTLTPTPTPPPTTAPTSTPTPSPKPTSTPKPTNTPSPQPTVKPTTILADSAAENSIPANEDLPDIDLSINNAMESTPTIEPEVLGTNSAKISKPGLPVILIITGTLLTLAGGILLTYQEIKNRSS